jgi:ribonuclease HIII
VARDILQENLNALRTFVSRQGWIISTEKEIAHGQQLIISDGTASNSVSLFKTGKFIVQGKTGLLQNELRRWLQEHAESNRNTTRNPSEPRLKSEPGLTNIATIITPEETPHIGSDEAGKGDYFGPLVVAAVAVDKNTGPQLRALGVRDSKTLTDRRILELAQEIKKVCRGRGTILTYQPEDYNKQYQAITNLNRLLARAHVQVLQSVARMANCDLAVVDQFGNATLIEEAARQAGLHLLIEQRVRAEADIAVAAASILARAEFVQQLAELSHQIGIELPKGASDPRILEVGHQIVARDGAEALRKVAKWHFQTTTKVLTDHQ